MADRPAPSAVTSCGRPATGSVICGGSVAWKRLGLVGAAQSASVGKAARPPAVSIVAPVRPGRGDYLETMQTLMWRERLKGRVDDPASVPEYRVVINAVSAEPSATERQGIEQIFQTMPAIEEPMMERKAYKQVDAEGLLGEIRDRTRKGIVQNHLTAALEEMEAILELFEDAMLAEAEAV